MKGRWINVGLGVWLCVAAALLGRSGVAVTNNLFLGLSVFFVAFFAMGIDPFRRLNTLLGIWAVISPFLLGYGDTGAAVNDVFVGILVVWASFWATQEPGRQVRHPVA